MAIEGVERAWRGLGGMEGGGCVCRNGRGSCKEGSMAWGWWVVEGKGGAYCNRGYALWVCGVGMRWGVGGLGGAGGIEGGCWEVSACTGPGKQRTTCT